jgi:predicted HAD superfamily phosphohydrolase
MEHFDNIYDKQISDSIRSLFELTSRIDERVKLLTETYSKTDVKFDMIVKSQQELLQRVTALESKNGSELKKTVYDLEERLREIEIHIQSIEYIAKGSQNKWDKAIEYGMKILVAIAATVLIYKLGMSGINISGGP